MSSAFVALARVSRRRKDWPSAARYFTRAAESANESASLWYEAAKALQYSDDAGAERAYARAVECADAPSDAWYRHGRHLEAAGKYADALEAYLGAEKAGGAAGHLAFRQARCLEALEDHVGAAVKFRRAAAAGFDPKQCFIELERLQSPDTSKWLQLDLYREGQDAFEAADAWTLKHARLAAEMNFYSEAAEIFEIVSAEQRLSEADVLLYVRALESAGQRTRERDVLRAALSLLPAEERSLGVGALFQRAGMWTRAREEFLRQLSADPDNAELVYRIGLSYDREYKWADAIAYFERAFFQSQQHSGRWAYKCGHAYERIQEFSKAVWWYRIALVNDSEQKHWWYRLGNCLKEAGELEGAYTALQRSVGNLPEQRLPETRDGVEPTGRSPHFGHLSSSIREIGDQAAESVLNGRWGIQSASGLVSMAEYVADIDLPEVYSALLAKAAGNGFGLSVSERQRIAAGLADSGLLSEAVELLLDSRPVRLPDGVNLKRYLPDNASRRSRLYAEFWGERPIDSDIVLLESNHGASAGCHPLAIFREMLRDVRFASKTFVWAVNDFSKVPQDVRECSRVRVVPVGSDEYLAYLATAGLLVNNVSFPPYFTRRPEQRYLNTWHGTPMKTLGRSMKQGLVEYENLERNFLQASHLMAPNELTKWALLDEHHLDGIYPGSVGLVGSPRLDALVRDGHRLREEIRARLGVAEDERLLLVAPTWRGGVSSHDLDSEALLEQLGALSSVDGVRVFYRAHRLTEKLVRDLNLPVEIVPSDIDTNDLLAAVDHLVTDYSSIVFDFLVTGRPVTLYVPDIEEYETTRGLYLSPHDLPASVARTVEELVADVQAGGSVEAEEYAAAVARYCSLEDGQAAARCIDFFLSDEGRGRELNGRPTVLFHASLIPNGIASALLAILQELVRSGVNVLLIVEPKVLRLEEDRAGIFRRLPEGIRLISRVGDTLMTPEEFFIRRVVESGLCDPGPEMIEKYRASWGKEARRVVGDIPVDAAVEWDGYATLWAGLMSAVGDDGTRRLIWQHNQMGQEQEHKYPELAALFQLYPWFDGVVSVSQLLSEQNRSHLEPLGLLPASGVQAVPNALLFDEIITKSQEPIDEEFLAYFEGGPTVLAVGRLSMEKNHEALIQSWQDVTRDHPEAKLLIVGSGPLEAQLATEIERLGLQASVHLVGQVSNPYPLMRHADLFVLPSLHEGQPVVLFEAMALDVPVAASPCPGNLEAMNMGYGVTLPTDATQLGPALVGLLQAPSVASGEFDIEKYRKAALEGFTNAVQLS